MIVVGAGPAGLAAARQLSRFGVSVSLYIFTFHVAFFRIYVSYCAPVLPPSIQ